MAFTKIKGSTLVEVIIAMTILGIVTGVSMMIMSNIFASNTSILNQKMSNAVDTEIAKIYSTNRFQNDIIDYDGFEVDIEFVEHSVNPNLKIGFISAVYKDETEPRIEKKILIKTND
jgi:Tfp pilus assembly protein PilV